jgi:hypothetical protein
VKATAAATVTLGVMATAAATAAATVMLGVKATAAATVMLGAKPKMIVDAVGLKRESSVEETTSPEATPRMTDPTNALAAWLAGGTKNRSSVFTVYTHTFG